MSLLRKQALESYFRFWLRFIVILSTLLLSQCSLTREGRIPENTLGQSKTAPGQSRERLERETLRELNRFRQSQGLSAVTPHPGLRTIARQHSADMARTRKMSHRGFSGRHSIASKRYRIATLVENVQYSYGSEPTGAGLTRQWAGSPGHRKNMLSPYRFAGIGIEKEGTLIYSTLLIGE